ncbi:E3 ubiquitin-protein ligase TRIM33 [Nematostella vectensis]|uniref:E3 ubiquitin-protein ligase TRIM33 n=1 Tax=Nematostella vectensis TaxID=45351 RepID=UPI002076F515|nr:E3 ubiquitin-protein ligase TRIM33 [Nematostella vectensis]
MIEKKDLTCPLCYTAYGTGYPQRIPRILDCSHTFCTECIMKIKELQGDVVECPTCKLRTLLTSSVDCLEKNMDILTAVFAAEQEEEPVCNFCASKVYPPKPARFFCTECAVYSCGNCSDEIHSQMEFRTHGVSLASAHQEATEDCSVQFPSRPSSGMSSTGTTSRPKLTSRPSSGLLDYSLLPECMDHKEKLKFYCRVCQTLCCGSCQIYGAHKGHSCFEVHEAEERERRALEKLQASVERHGDKYIKARGDVQRMIEEVKQETIIVKDVARRYYRELRAAIDEGEKVLMQEISKRSDAKLKSLNEQVSQMIDIASRAKTASRNTDKALGMDYYEMLNRKKEVEHEIREVMGLLCDTTPVTTANLKCQFPNHETLVSGIRTCAKLVQPTGPPEKLSCSVNKDGNVVVTWNSPDMTAFLYPVVGYVLQCTIGEDDAFVEVYKGCDRIVTFDRKKGLLPVGRHVQFQSCAINTIGRSAWSFPYGLKVPGEPSPSR